MTTPAPDIGTATPASLAAAIEAAWNRLPEDLPADTVQGAFAPGWTASLVARVLAEPRTRGAAVDRLAQRLGLVRPSVDDFAAPESRVILLGPPAIRDAARIAGVMRNAGRIGRLILRQEREAVAEAVGREAFDAAVAHATRQDAPGPPWPVAEVLAACERDGPVCLAAWAQRLSDASARWVRALVPDAAAWDGGAPDPAVVESARLGAAVVLARG